MSKLLDVCNKVSDILIKTHKEGKPINISKTLRKVCREYSMGVMPRTIDIIACIPKEYTELISALKVKPVRTASGVAIIAVMAKPHRCPHIALTGNICIYCPGGPDSMFEYSSQSYTGYEPTSMRAIRNRYDPFLQARERLKQLESLGHSVDKIEFIVMGGTFLSLSEEYRESFIMGLHDALSGNKSRSLEEAVKSSENSRTKCVAITIETRPDYCVRPHLNQMLLYGCTRIEIGVQSIYEDVAIDTNRGHSVESVCASFSMAKDAGYKIVSHLMPNLPNVDFQRDIVQFKEFFWNPRFRTDGLKIYPTLVIRDTGLYELWKNKSYRNYSPDLLVELIARILSMVPPWTRIYRVQRDIPMTLVSSGVEFGNIRELALMKMKEHGTKCRDVRTREVGIQNIHCDMVPKNINIVRRDYIANDGWETFLSIEDLEQDILIGLLRLRKCSINTYRPELKNVCLNIRCNENKTDNDEEMDFIIESGGEIVQNRNCSIIRELHVYGSAVPISFENRSKYQHKGFGSFLMNEAEAIARNEHGSSKIAIISGVGTRDYYRKFGYELEGPYMVKYIL